MAVVRNLRWHSTCSPVTCAAPGSRCVPTRPASPCAPDIRRSWTDPPAAAPSQASSPRSRNTRRRPGWCSPATFRDSTTGRSPRWSHGATRPGSQPRPSADTTGCRNRCAPSTSREAARRSSRRSNPAGIARASSWRSTTSCCSSRSLRPRSTTPIRPRMQPPCAPRSVPAGPPDAAREPAVLCAAARAGRTAGRNRRHGSGNAGRALRGARGAIRLQPAGVAAESRGKCGIQRLAAAARGRRRDRIHPAGSGRMNSFEFSPSPVDTAALAAPLARPAAGGFATFEGRVRDLNEGRHVTALDYEAFEALATAEGARIVEAALARHGASAGRCVHRVGHLAVGDVAVWVGVAAPHRGEAFAACREIIDAVKHRLPIWKKEHYADGDSGWVNCAHPEGTHVRPCAFDYARQAALPEVGARGQARLAESTVLVVGAGGLGCAALASLAGAGVGELLIVDHDRVQASNLHRQPLFTVADVGRPKAEAAAGRLAAYNPAIGIRPVARRFDAESADELVAAADVVVDCTDNFAAKFLANDAAMRGGKPAVLASVYQYEGQLQAVRADRGGSCLRCVWPDATRDGLVGNCEQAGVLGPVPAILGQMQALEVLKILLDLPGQLQNELLLVDLLEHGQRRLSAPRNPDCRGSCARLAAGPRSGAADDLDLALPLAAAAVAGYRIVDIREPMECEFEPLPVAGQLAVPLGRLIGGELRVEPGLRYLLVCAHGVRSRAAAELLRSRGHPNVWSLRGGLAGAGT